MHCRTALLTVSRSPNGDATPGLARHGGENLWGIGAGAVKPPGAVSGASQAAVRCRNSQDAAAKAVITMPAQ